MLTPPKEKEDIEIEGDEYTCSQYEQCGVEDNLLHDDKQHVFNSGLD